MTRRARAGARRVSPAGRGALILVLSVVLTTLVAPAASGQLGITESPAPDPSQRGQSGAGIELTVTSLTGVLGPGAPTDDDADGPSPVSRDLELRAVVENVGDQPLDGLQLIVEVHPAVSGRGALYATFSDGLPTQSLHVDTRAIQPGTTLEPGELAGVASEMAHGDVDWADGRGGVHPIRVAVTRGTQVLTEAISAVVWLNEEPTDPLVAMLVWPIDTPPWRAAGGAYPYRVDLDVRRGGRLDVLLSAAELTSTPLVLAPAAHLLEDLGDRSDGYESVSRQDDGSVEVRTVTADERPARRAARTLRRVRELADATLHPPLAGTYADADIAALAAGGTEARDLAADAAMQGRERLQRQLGVTVDATAHLATGPLTSTVLDLLPGDAVLLPASAVEYGDLRTTTEVGEPVRRLQAPAGRVLTGLLADPYLEEAFASPYSPGGPLLAAQRPIAESAMAYLAAPSAPDRGLIIAPPQTWAPSPQTANEILEGLGAAPWLRLTSASRVVSDARRSTQSVTFTTPEPGRFPTAFVDDLLEARDGIAGMSAALEGIEGESTGRSPAQLQEDVTRATSRWFWGSGEGEAMIRDVRRSVDLAFGAVEVTTGSVTLTSDTGQVPITLQRTRGDPIQVVVNVESGGGLVWPEDRRSPPMLLAEDTSQTVSFPARAMSTGTFPVTVRVTDPSGIHELSATTMSVHSRAISGPALAAIGVLIGILLLVGALRRRDRSDPEPPPAPLVAVPDDDATGEEPPVAAQPAAPGPPRHEA